MAEELDVDVRTLWNWEREAKRGEALPRAGRRAHGEKERGRARRLVADEWARQGRRAGWRSISAAFSRRPQEERVPLRLIQEALSELKHAASHVEREALAEVREGHDVLFRDVIWGEDGLYVGRGERGRVEAELIKDVGPGRTLLAAVGPPATQDDVIEHLMALAKERGGYPLVLQHDRGGAYRGNRLEAFLEEKRVVTLLSRPHTPTDNAMTERAIEDLRAESQVDGHGKAVDEEAVREAFENAMRTINEGRRLARHGYRCAKDVDQEMRRGDAIVERERFYAEARAAMETAKGNASDPRSAWRASREALLRLLERHGLVTLRRPRATSTAAGTTTVVPVTGAGGFGPARRAAAAATRRSPPIGGAATSNGPSRVGTGLAELLGQLKTCVRAASSSCSDVGALQETSPGGCARTQNPLCSP